jgi:hypothetical protein
MSLESVNWNEATTNWNTTHRIWSGNLVTVEIIKGKRDGGGRRKRQEHYITVRVKVFGREFSMTKIKQERVNTAAGTISSRVIESLKPNIKIKLGKK